MKNKYQFSKGSTRRTFLKQSAKAGIVLGVGANIPSILTKGSPNEKVVVGVMGVNSRGHWLAELFARQENSEVAYICDVDERAIAKTIAKVNEFQKRKPKGEKDVRRVLDDKSIDALVIAAPDHWHTPAAIMACKAGKHVYVEKPCGHNPCEGELLIKAARKYNRVVQMGNQRRSWSNNIQCMEDIKSGIIGRVYFARAWYAKNRLSIGFGKKAAVPSWLDYELWQGPAPRRPYRDNLIHYNWHWFWHWGTGEALNNGSHEMDVMRWGLEVDYPTRVTFAGGRYHFNDDWESPDTQVICFDFKDGKTMTWEGRSCNNFAKEEDGRGVIFHGEKGTINVVANSYTVYDNSEENQIIKEVKDLEEPQSVNTVGPGAHFDIPHIKNFISSIKEKKKPNSDIEEGHKSVLLGHLGNIAYRTGRSLNCDSSNGHIVGDKDAEKLWAREYEKGWEPTT